MVLRSQDVSGSLGGVDKFHDAMRVLSRRTAVRPGEEPVQDEEPAVVRRPSPATRRAAAARRRRLLIALLLLSVGTLAGALLGSVWLLGPHLAVDLLLVAFVVHLRRQAIRRAERELQAGMGERPRRAAAPRPAVPRPAASRPAAPAAADESLVRRVPVHVAGIPNRMPPRPQPLAAPAASYGAAHVAPAPARGAQGEAWSPVPVPIPTYLTAPVAPRRRVDLTKPGAYSDGLAEAEREVGIVDAGPQLDEILDRRRAVNDW